MELWRAIRMARRRQRVEGTSVTTHDGVTRVSLDKLFRDNQFRQNVGRLNDLLKTLTRGKASHA